MKKGEIYKLKTGTSIEQLFIMLLSDDDFHCVVLFNNISTDDTIGDTTLGFDINNFEISNLKEISNFIISNNL